MPLSPWPRHGFQRSSPKRLSMAILICALSLQMSACSNDKSIEFWRQVPIQMVRVSQTDSYTQTFVLGTSTSSSGEELTLEKRQELDERMDRIFITMIGAKNWQHLKNLYGVSAIRDELIDKKVHMEGLINFTAYLDPLDDKHVILEGSGRFFAVRDKTGEMLLSGDSHITPQRYMIDDFKSGCIPLQTSIYTTRIPGKPTFYKEAVIQYDLIIDTGDKDNNTYSVDYRREHKGYIDLDGDNSYSAEHEMFALLKLNGRYSQAKLLDLSGIKFIKKNYNINNAARLDAAKEADKDRQRSCVQHKPGNV